MDESNEPDRDPPTTMTTLLHIVLVPSYLLGTHLSYNTSGIKKTFVVETANMKKLCYE